MIASPSLFVSPTMISSDLIVRLCSVFIVVVMTLCICLDAICVPARVASIFDSIDCILFPLQHFELKALTVLVNCVFI